MNGNTRFICRILFLACVAIGSTTILSAAEDVSFEPLANRYATEIRPLLQAYCLVCHSAEKKEGELDLEQFVAIRDVRKFPLVWQKMIEMLDNREMPPEDAKQITADQRKRIRDWAVQYIETEGRASAGDPGRVILRRLSNVEYDLTVRDLTGIDLRPSQQFPGDGAAGEGFTNVGDALVMSPVLVQKYFDASKVIADHAVLLPEGFRFSAASTRRDWTNELVGQIRDLYRQYTDPAGSRRVSLQGLNFEAESGGRIPLDAYLSATIANRQELENGKKSIAEVATANHLSPKYLQTVWTLLHDSQPSPLFDPLRSRWRNAQPADAAALAESIRKWQSVLTKFNSVAHFKTWQESISPLADLQSFRLKLEPTAGSSNVIVRLITRDAGDGSQEDLVEWRRPRLESSGRPILNLRDVRVGIQAALEKRRTLQAAAKYLAAVDDARNQKEAVDVAAMARDRELDSQMLAAWLNYLGIGSGALKIETIFSDRSEKGGGYEFVKGWGSSATPNIAANSSDQQVRIPGIMKPHSVAVHPAPKRNVAVGWRSPFAGAVKVEARVQHAHPECGNGLAWMIQLRRGAERRQLAGGEVDRSQAAKIEPIQNLAVQAGDLVSLLIGPRASDHTCDLTEVDLTVSEAGGESRTWNLSRDVSPNIVAGNPHADAQGNPDVWYFYHEAVDSAGSLAGIPRGSILDQWRDEPQRSKRDEYAEQLQQLLRGAPPADANHPNAILHRDLMSLNGPLLGILDYSQLAQPGSSKPMDGRESEAEFGLAVDRFGKNPDGRAIDAANLITAGPSAIEFRLPADLAAGREFVVDAALVPTSQGAGSVQVQVATDDLDASDPLIAGIPILAQPAGAARSRLEKAFAEFRRVFPAAVCYPKIVPVDEVVTLVQLHRDDERLADLMLSESEQKRLERLWDELRFVSHDALKVQEAYGQFMEYVTQDGDVRVFEPLRKPIADRASAFRQRLIDTEPKQLDALVAFAEQAYRRPLRLEEQQGLRDLYARLRQNEIEHDAAFRLVLARILVAPTFLYRVEKPAHPSQAQPVSDWELASRLSYFLWSSMPDEELRRAATDGSLRDSAVLDQQAKRMLGSDKVRALATEFACQWLDIRGFDTLDEKNEQLFPEFADLRDDMYEESVRFFVDLFQRDGSVLEILNADYAILNAPLAKHYGVPFPSEPGNAEWRRVDGLRKLGRGGILGMATTLAKHSGASRTSPVLRGNWVSEFLLGEKLPKPPKGVPQLPEAENSTELTVRQLVEKHREVASCAKCHDRIDAFGFALESFDTIGRSRDKDLAGRPIDTKVTLANGVAFDGLSGLRDYLSNERRDQFVHQFCKKLVGYALGRRVQISDEPLLEEIESRLKSNDYRVSSAFGAILHSQQFRYQRGRSASTSE